MQVLVTTSMDEDGSIDFRVQESRDRTGLITVALCGELDSRANAVVDGVMARLRHGAPGDVVVDLSRVTYLNGHGLTAMLLLERATRSRDNWLTLRCGPGNIGRLLRIIGLGDHLQETDQRPGPDTPDLRLVQGGQSTPGPRHRRPHRAHGPDHRARRSDAW